MSSPNPPLDAADLLAQTAWLRRLARQLVRDPDGAEDAVQDTWLAALRHPPDPGRPTRPWLAAVLRNFARMRARSAGYDARFLSVGQPGQPITYGVRSPAGEERLLKLVRVAP